MVRNQKLTKPILAALLLQLFLVTGTKANDVSIPLATPLATSLDTELITTTPTEDYVIQKQRQYDEDLTGMDNKLAALKFNYESELKTIITQRDFLLAKLKIFDHKIYPLRLLSHLDKHCVQKYEGKIPTAASVNASITNCATLALEEFESFAQAARSLRESFNGYYSISLPVQLSNCELSYPDTYSENYNNCIYNEINTADIYTEAYLRLFNDEMAIASSSAENRVRKAIECSFTIVYNTASAMGETDRLIQNCSLGMELCPHPDPPKSTVSCSNQVLLNDSEVRQPFIKNPFFDRSGKIDCAVLSLG